MIVIIASGESRVFLQHVAGWRRIQQEWIGTTAPFLSSDGAGNLALPVIGRTGLVVIRCA
jgi:hypothetical protein